MSSRNIVNLDAMIPRASMAPVIGDPLASPPANLFLRDLDAGGVYAPMLRKPDFQRETSHWDPARVADLIEAFVDGNLIPAVILWLRGNHIFVIDGAHRLGAILAWIKDDYGDRGISHEYFGSAIPPEQTKAALKTRDLVGKQVGHFGEYKSDSIPREIVAKRLPRIWLRSFTAQWVPTTDDEVAEESFFIINRSAAELDPTEHKILRSRDAASAIAARAVVHGGSGHKYWARFSPDARSLIETTAKQIREALYNPPIADGPVKTLDLPVAGRGYNHLGFVFDLVKWANNVPELKKRRGSDDIEKAPADPDGSQTLQFLKAVHRAVQRITSDESPSLGLHPAVYFYTRGGEFQPNAFLAIAEFVQVLHERNAVREFLAVRGAFEDFLVAHKDYITNIVKTTGGGAKARPRTVRYLEFVQRSLRDGMSDAETVAALQADADLASATGVRRATPEPGSNPKRDLSKATKSAAFMAAALGGALRCPGCRGFIHANSMQFDHPEGRGPDARTDATGGVPMHPKCNSIKGGGH